MAPWVSQVPVLVMELSLGAPMARAGDQSLEESSAACAVSQLSLLCPRPKGPHRLQLGLHRGWTRCPLFLVAVPQQPSPVAPPKTRVFLGEHHSNHPERELCQEGWLCSTGSAGRTVGVLGVFFCISAAVSWHWEAAEGPRPVLSTAGTEQDTLPARPLPKAGTESCPARPWRLPPAPAGPRGAHPALLPPSSVRPGEHSSRNSAFGVMGLGQKQQQPGGNTLEWDCYSHIISLREQEQENPACPQQPRTDRSKPGGATQPLSCPS